MGREVPSRVVHRRPQTYTTFLMLDGHDVRDMARELNQLKSSMFNQDRAHAPAPVREQSIMDVMTTTEVDTQSASDGSSNPDFLPQLRLDSYGAPHQIPTTQAASHSTNFSSAQHARADHEGSASAAERSSRRGSRVECELQFQASLLLPTTHLRVPRLATPAAVSVATLHQRKLRGSKDGNASRRSSVPSPLRPAIGTATPHTTPHYTTASLATFKPATSTAIDPSRSACRYATPIPHPAVFTHPLSTRALTLL